MSTSTGPDGADRRPGHDVPAAREQRQRPGRGDQRPRGPHLVPPLPGVERAGCLRGEPAGPAPHPEPPVRPAGPAGGEPERDGGRRGGDGRGDQVPVRGEPPHRVPRPVRRGCDPEPPGARPGASGVAGAARRSPARRRPRPARPRPWAGTTGRPGRSAAAARPATTRSERAGRDHRHRRERHRPRERRAARASRKSPRPAALRTGCRTSGARCRLTAGPAPSRAHSTTRRPGKCVTHPLQSAYSRVSARARHQP